MAVTRELLKEQMKRLEINYGVDKFKITKEVFELWFDILSKCEEKELVMAFTECLTENEFAPNIAGLMKYYRKIIDERNQYRDHVLQQYAVIRDVFEEKFSADTLNTILEYLSVFPQNMRKAEMTEMTYRAITFCHDCEYQAKEKPSVKEYIEKYECRRADYRVIAAGSNKN